MKFLLKILFALVGLQSAFAVEEWHNFSVPFPIWDAVPAAEGVWLATDGGMRYRDANNDVVYTPANGLEASAFYGVVNTPMGVFAVSEYGLIARLTDNSSKWEVWNRSFVSSSVRVIPGLLKFAGGVLVIAFENRISFVDIVTASSILSIERVGDVAFSLYSPEKIEIDGDTLFVSTSRGVLARQMDWENLKEDVRLVDPGTWKRVEGRPLDVRDSLKVVVDGKTLKDSILYDNGKSQVLWQFKEKGYTFLVGHDLVARYKDGKLEDLTAYAPYELDGVYEVQAIPEGGVIAASREGFISANMGDFWFEPTLAFLGHANRNDAYAYRMKVLSLLPKGMVMYHLWGFGLHLYQLMGTVPYYSYTPDVDNCLDRFLPSFMVAVGTTVAPDGSGFLTATTPSKGGYSIDYVTLEPELTCATGVGSEAFAGPLVARQDPNSSDWILYVSTRESFSAFASGGLDILRFPSPSKNGGRLLNPVVKSIAGLDGNTPIDMVIDEEREVLWLVTSTGIGYMELGSDTIRKPVSMNGLLGAEYTSIDVDPHGNVWVGTTMQGMFRLERRNGSLDTLLATHYTMVDGLLDNSVMDLAVDKTVGAVWTAHEKGVSSYRRNDLRRSKDFMTDSAKADVKVYPVPFRPREHKFVRIDNISEKARVDIYNRGGALIRSFAGSEVHGGRAEWDGTGKDGRMVAPGVYYYVVRTHSKIKKGKFIVSH